MTAAVESALPLSIGVIVLVGQLLWLRWLRRTAGAPRWIVVVVLLLLVASESLGIASLIALGRSFDAVGTGVDPAHRQQMLAQSISLAMSLAAVGILAKLGSIVVLLAATWRYAWSRRQ